MPKNGARRGHSGSPRPSPPHNLDSGGDGAQRPPDRDDNMFGAVSGSPAGINGAAYDERRPHIHGAASRQMPGGEEAHTGTPERCSTAVRGGAASAGGTPSSEVSPVPHGAAPASPTAWWLDQHGAEVPLSPGARQQLEVRGRVDAWAASVKRYEQAASPEASPEKQLTPSSARRRMSHNGLGTRPVSRSFNTPSSADPFPQEAYTATLDQPIVSSPRKPANQTQLDSPGRL